MKLKLSQIAPVLICAVLFAYWDFAPRASANPGYTFNAPSGISLGSMTPSFTPYVASSADGNLVGDSINGYKVTGKDAKTTNTGFMVSGSNVLHNMLQIGPNTNLTSPAAAETTFLDTSGVTNTSYSLFVSQLIAGNDIASSGYTITITFTVIER
jgi:hypothetical protein